MKQALISPNEQAYSYSGTPLGERVAEVTTQPFEVAPPLFWVVCPDDCVADQWYYDTNTLSCLLVPVRPIVEAP